MPALRIIFMGSPDFSVPVLAALIDAGHEVVRVYSQPPRPAGRGQKERPCPVHAHAAERGIDVRTPKTLRDEQASDDFEALQADVCVVVAYGLILPKRVLDAPRLGCVNVHASLLPRWRGAAPIHRAILAGDDKSGVCIMRMEEGLDTGPVLLRDEIPLTPGIRASDLHDQLSHMGARLILPALDGLADGSLDAVAQAEEGVTYAAKLEKAEGRIDWRDGADAIERKIRAFDPWPGVSFKHGGEVIKVRGAELLPGAAGNPGVLLDDDLLIACGSGAVRPVELQRPGKRWMARDDFLRGFPLARGTVLG